MNLWSLIWQRASMCDMCGPLKPYLITLTPSYTSSHILSKLPFINEGVYVVRSGVCVYLSVLGVTPVTSQEE